MNSSYIDRDTAEQVRDRAQSRADQRVSRCSALVVVVGAFSGPLTHGREVAEDG